MNVDNTSILQNLLSTGQVNTDRNFDVATINKTLEVIGYEALMFPHSNILVLKNHSIGQNISLPWKESLVEEAKTVFMKIANEEFVNKNTAVFHLLVKNNWIKEETEFKITFTERSLVQFSGFIESLKGKYKKCEICEFLTTEGECHKECKMLLMN